MLHSGSQEDNFAVCRDLALQAARRGCAMLFLPECCAFIGANQQEVGSSATTQPMLLLWSAHRSTVDWL